MRRSADLVLVFAAAAIIGVGCSSGSTESPHQPQVLSDDTVLLPVNTSITEACRYSAAVAEWRALCPTVFPKRYVGWPPPDSPGILVRSSPPIIEIGYGAPVEGRGRFVHANLWRNQPCCFLHFDVQPENVYGAPDWHPKKGGHDTLGGRAGWLQPAESNSYVGSPYFANHLRFFFAEGGEHYVVTLHDFGAGTKELLEELVAGLEPAKPLPEAVPRSAPAPCELVVGSTTCKYGPITDVAATGDAIWAAKPGGGAIARIDPVAEERRLVDVPSTYLAADGGWLWSVGYRRGEWHLTGIDASDEVRTTRSIGRGLPAGVAAGEGAIWITDPWRGRVTRLDPMHGGTTVTKVGRGASAVAIGFGSGWVANTGAGTVTRIDERTSKVQETIEVGLHPQAVVTTGGSIWVANTGDGTLSQIDPTTNEISKTLSVGSRPIDLTEDGNCLWVTDFDDEALRCVSLSTSELSDEVIETGTGPFAATAAFGSLWIVDQEGLQRVPDPSP